MKKLLFAGVLILFAAAGCGQQTQPVQSPKPDAQTFSGSYQTGFEGHNTKFDYSISYLEDTFIPAKTTQGFALNEKSNGHMHKVLFGYNGGLGAASSAEFWNAHQYCSSCKESANILSVVGAEDMKTYSNSTDEWVVFRAGDDYVVINIKQPDSAALSAFKTLSVRTTKIVTQ